jgi:hypothetical protein
MRSGQIDAAPRLAKMPCVAPPQFPTGSRAIPTPNSPKSSPTCRQASGRNHACCPTIHVSTASTGTPLVYVGEVGSEAATRWLDLNDKFAETERELALARDRVLDVIRPWHEDACAKRKAHEATVVVETPTGALRVS